VVNTPHNILPIASGAIFLIASILGPGAARLWFQIFGIAYAAMAIMGSRFGMIFNVISNNRNDAWGHAMLALIMPLIGFAIPNKPPLPNRVASSPKQAERSRT
jgi:hypothetical protein